MNINQEILQHILENIATEEDESKEDTQIVEMIEKNGVWEKNNEE